ncbi:hypothetical protein BCAR13_740020 [Paraburkholderia caribensis]|nr:hypothetical protein BCAR13_740020 [Paraburkholderia caribensis]
MDNFVENVPCNLSRGPSRKHRLGRWELLRSKNMIKINELNGIKWALGALLSALSTALPTCGHF